MRKVLFIVFGLLIFTTLATIIVLNGTKQEERFVTISNYYSYVYTDDKRMNVPVYINLKNHPLYERKYIRHVNLIGNNNNFRQTVRLDEIVLDGKERYLNEDYYKIIYRLDLPKLGSNIHLSNCFIEFELDEFSTKYTFLIGEVSLYYYQNVGCEEALQLTGLQGYKSDNVFVSRLEKIILDCNIRNNVIIKNVEIGLKLNTTYYIANDQIIIVIPEGNEMLSEVPIIVTYQLDGEEKKTIIDNFRYFQDYFLLLDNGCYANVYPID